MSLTSPIPLAALSLFLSGDVLAVAAPAALGLALLTDPTGGEAIFVLLLTCSEGTAEGRPMKNNFVL